MGHIADLLVRDNLTEVDRRELHALVSRLELIVQSSLDLTGPRINFEPRLSLRRAADIYTGGFATGNEAKGVQLINRAAAPLLGAFGLRDTSTGRLTLSLRDPGDVNNTATQMELLNADNGRIHFFATGNRIASFLKATDDENVSQLDMLILSGGAKITAGGNLKIIASADDGTLPTGETETVFNERGANLDFRVEGDTDENLITADAGLEAVGIGKASPAAKLHIDQASTSGAKPVITLDQADIDVEFLSLIGSSEDGEADRSLVDVADMTTAGALVGWFQVAITDVQATNPISDGVYYVPFCAAPSA